jgi:hypothetical protein
MPGVVWLRWPVLNDGYKIRRLENGKRVITAPETPRPEAKPSAKQRVIDLRDGAMNGLFAKFMWLAEGSEGDVLAFASKYGLLGIGEIVRSELPFDYSRYEEYQESLDLWALHVHRIRDTWQRWEDVRDHDFPDAAEHLTLLPVHPPHAESWIPHPPIDDYESRELNVLQQEVNQILWNVKERCFWERGRLVRHFVCESLMEALEVQLAYSITEDERIRFCPMCSNSWLEAERRADKVWCDACEGRAGNWRKQARRCLAKGMTPEEVAQSYGWPARAIDELLELHGSARTQFGQKNGSRD